MFSINAIEGQSLTVVAEYKGADNLPVDITTWTLKARIGTLKTRVLIESTCVVTDGPNGVFQIVFSAIQISTLEKGKYIIEIAREVSGELSTIAQGDFNLSYSLFGE